MAITSDASSGKRAEILSHRTDSVISNDDSCFCTLPVVTSTKLMQLGLTPLTLENSVILFSSFRQNCTQNRHAPL